MEILKTRNFFRKIMAGAVIGIIASLLVIFYLLYLVPKRENELNGRGMRILSRLETNITEKKKNFTITFDEIDSKLDHSKNESSIKNVKYLRNIDLTKWTKLGQPQSVFLYDKSIEKWFLIFYGHLYNPNPKTTTDNTFKFKKESKISLYQYSFQEFIDPLISYRKDFFEDYFIIHKDSDIVYRSGNLDYKTNLLNDTTFFKNGIRNDKVTELKIKGKNYKVFCHSFDSNSELGLTICGLISTEKYNEHKFMLNNFQILLLISAFLLLLLLLPIIKVFTITMYERLMKSDIASIGIGLMFACALITILFCTQIFYIDNGWDQCGLKVSNDSIKDRFTKELDNHISNMNRLNTRFSITDTATFKKWYKSNKYDFYISGVKSRLLDNYITKSDSYTEHLSFTDNTGLIKAYWSYDNDSIVAFKVDTRKYFLDILNDNGWKLSPKGSVFSFQPIYSYTDQKNSVVISQKASRQILDMINQKKISFDTDNYKGNDFSVMSIETYFFSAQHPVLYPGSGFCIIDENGNTLFHSDSKRNLMENFIEESNQDEVIKAAIINRGSDYIDLEFYGKKHECYISPISNLPLYVVTFQESSYRSNALGNIMSYSIVMSFTVIFILLGILLFFFIAVARTRYLKKDWFDFKFLYPNRRNFAISRTLCGYLILSTILFCVLVIAIADDSLSQLFVAVMMPINTVVMGAAIIFYSSYRKYLTLPFRDAVYAKYNKLVKITFTISICILLTFLYFLCNYAPKSYIGYSLFFFFLSLSFANASQIFFKPEQGQLVRFMEQLKHTGLISYYLFRKAIFKLKIIEIRDRGVLRLRKKQEALIPFIAILTLLNLSVIPTCVFFTNATLHEEIFTEKNRALNVAMHIKDRADSFIFPLIIEDSVSISSKKIDLLKNGIYAPHFDISIRTEGAKYASKLNVQSLCDSVLGKFYTDVTNASCIANNNQEGAKAFLAANTNSDQTWFWSKNNGSTSLNYNYPFRQKTAEKQAVFGGIVLRSLNQGADIHWKVVLFFSVCFLATIILLYYILTYVYRKLTLGDYFHTNDGKQTGSPFLEQLSNSKTDLLIISPPGSGLDEQITKQIRNEFFSLIPITDTEFDKLSIESTWYDAPHGSIFKKLIIIRNFELISSNNEALPKRINLLEKYLRSKEIKLIWISSTDPISQIKILRKNGISAYSKAIKENNLTDIDSFVRKSQDYDKMLSILDDLCRVYFPLKLEKDYRMPMFDIKYMYISNLLNKELKYSHYLNNLRWFIYDKWASNPLCLPVNVKSETELFRQSNNINDEIILKIQDMASNYYLSIWTTLSTQERFVLYDMAVDGLTNYNNFTVLRLLQEKGLLVFDNIEGTIRIFNKSFRNFILSQIEPAEAASLEQEIKGTSTWQTTKTVLLLFIVASGGVLFFTQQNIFNQGIALATALTSAIPLLLGLIGLKKN